MGKSSRGSEGMSHERHGRASPVPARHFQNEVIGTRIRMVAELRQGFRSNGGQLRHVPTTSKRPPEGTVHPWESSTRPWQRIHIDYAEVEKQMYLVVVDSFSKWLDVVATKGSTSEITIRELRRIFATMGVPGMCVTDNASSFTSETFALFMSRNGINHVTSAPYHAASNGLAERAVQTFKKGLAKMGGSDKDLALQRFLFAYRCTPHSATGVTPAERLMNRKLFSALDQLKPSVAEEVRKKHDKTAKRNGRKDRSFQVNDHVYIKNFAPGLRWLEGIVTNVTGPLSYEVQLRDGRLIRRHVDHVRTRNASTGADDCVITHPPHTDERERRAEVTPILESADIERNDETVPYPDIEVPRVFPEVNNDATEVVIPTSSTRRSVRHTNKPDRYGDNIYDK